MFRDRLNRLAARRSLPYRAMPDGSATLHADAAPGDRRDSAPPTGMPARGRTIRSSATPSSRALEDSGSADAAHRLAAAARGAARRRRAHGRGGADVCEVAQLRRIRVRPRLGARVRARRRRATTRSSRSPCRSARCPARGCCAAAMPACPLRAMAQRAGAGVPGARRSPRCTSRSAPRPNGRRWARPGWLQRARHAVPLGQRRLTRASTTSSAALSSRKRKVLRRERRDANAAGLTFRALRGAGDRASAHWDAFYRLLHLDRGSQMGQRLPDASASSPLLGERLGDKVVLMMAEKGGKPVAGALNLIGRGGALRPQLGLPRRLAVPAFRALLLPGDRLRDRARAEAGRGGRAGPSTRSSAAICRSRPSRRIGSPMPACAARSPISSTTSGRRWLPRSRRWQPPRRSGRTGRSSAFSLWYRNEMDTILLPRP